MQIEEFNKLLNVPMNMTCDDGRKFAVTSWAPVADETGQVAATIEVVVSRPKRLLAKQWDWMIGESSHRVCKYVEEEKRFYLSYLSPTACYTDFIETINSNAFKFAGIRFLTNSVVLKIINQKYLPVSNWWKIELVLEER